MNWSASPRRARRRWLPVALVVAALHLLLLGLWQRALNSPPPRPTNARPPPVLVWLRPAPPRAVPPPEPAEPTARARPARPAQPAPLQRRTPERPPPEPESTPVQAAALPASAATPAPAASTAAAATAAASAPAGPLLDSEATRRAIRNAARQRSSGEMAAEASGASAPLGTQERMGQEIARGARGDCLKGEYAGAGMGLLSLPFWLIAEFREKCRR